MAWLVYAGIASCFIRAARAELLAKEPSVALGSGDPLAKRFWCRLLGVKQSLFTQILGCIAQLAYDHDARFDKELPYSVRRFVVNVLVPDHLRDVKTDTLIRKLFRLVPTGIMSILGFSLIAKEYYVNGVDWYVVITTPAIIFLLLVAFRHNAKDKDASSLSPAFWLDGLYYVNYGARASVIMKFYRDMLLIEPDSWHLRLRR